jgi:two-component system response regulator GlrR
MCSRSSCPPLRQREDDIVLLARYFLAKYTHKFRAPAREFSPGALQKLVCHSWPGNVRELKNVIQRAVVLADRAVLRADHNFTGDAAENGPEPQSFRQLKAKAIDRFEESYVRFGFADFERAFGGLAADSELSYAVQHFFANGGSEA